MKKVVRNFCLTALIGVTILSGCYRYKRIEEVAKPSPEQTKIAFVSDRDGNLEIYVMNVDGSEQTNLTNNSASDWFPSWSPDGKKIVFNSDRDGNYEFYVMNADGSEKKRLTNNRANDWSSSCSPDGKKIVFNSVRDWIEEIISEIYVMNADGSEQKRLTNNPARDFSTSWSPFLPSMVKEKNK